MSDVQFIRKNGRIIPIRKKKSDHASDIAKGVGVGVAVGVSGNKISEGLASMGQARAKAASAFFAKVGPASRLADEYILAAAQWERSKAPYAAERSAKFMKQAGFQNRLASNYKALAKGFGSTSNAMYKASGFVSKNKFGVAVSAAVSTYALLRLRE